MTPEELLKGITNASEAIALNWIEQAKREWEFDAYKKGWEECEKATQKVIDNAFKSNS